MDIAWLKYQRRYPQDKEIAARSMTADLAEARYPEETKLIKELRALEGAEIIRGRNATKIKAQITVENPEGYLSGLETAAFKLDYVWKETMKANKLDHVAPHNDGLYLRYQCPIVTDGWKLYLHVTGDGVPDVDTPVTWKK